MAINTGVNKYLTGSLTSNGAVTQNDSIYFTNGSLTNNGHYTAVGNANLNTYAGSGLFTNTGTFEKSGAAGSNTVAAAGFSNSGTGVVQVDSGTTLTLTGTNHFASGSSITGAGTLAIAGVYGFTTSTFDGNFSDNNNLTLAGGTFTGGASSTSSTTLTAGGIDWTGGSIAGTWNLAAGTQLAINTGVNKYLTGGLTSDGTATQNDSIAFSNGSLTNNGHYTVVGNANLNTYAGTGLFTNNSGFVKNGGGLSTVSAISFNNAATGLIDIQSGTLQLGNNFNNQGQIDIETGANLTITSASVFAKSGEIYGSGAINGNLTNAGVILPGVSGAAGDLTINGNYTQTATGDYTVQLAATNSLLTINGNASFGGELKLLAFSGVHLSLHEQIVIAAISGSLSSNYFGGQTLFSDNVGDQFLLTQTNNSGITDLSLQVTSLAAVPLPPAVSLFGSALAGCWWFGRRKVLKA